MPDLYNISLITQETSLISQALVFNYWSNGLLLSGLICVFALILFTGVRFADKDMIIALIYSTTFGSIVSILAWLFRYAGEPSVPTLVPFMFIFILGAAIFMKVFEGSIRQTD